MNLKVNVLKLTLVEKILEDSDVIPAAKIFAKRLQLFAARGFRALENFSAHAYKKMLDRL